MGDNYTVAGSVDISPALTWGQMKDLSYIAQNGKRNQSLVFEVDSEKEHTDRGVLTVKSCQTLVPSGYSDGYYLVENLRDLIGLFPEHTFTGEFTVYPEHGLQAFPYKVVARGREAVKQVLEQVWVDSPEEGSA